jgi:hypothetical protein
MTRQRNQPPIPHSELELGTVTEDAGDAALVLAAMLLAIAATVAWLSFRA